MQMGGELCDPLYPRLVLGRVEVNVAGQPCHQQRWHTIRSNAGNVSGQNARDRKPASCHHVEVRDFLLHGGLKRDLARRVLPQHHEGSRVVSLNRQAMDGGVDATGQSTMADDATALAHRCRNPGESICGGSTLEEFARSPVAVDGLVLAGHVVAGHDRRLYRADEFRLPRLAMLAPRCSDSGHTGDKRPTQGMTTTPRRSAGSPA